MPPTAPNSRQPEGGSRTDLQTGPGCKTTSESSATPTARQTTEKRGSKVNSRAK